MFKSFVLTLHYFVPRCSSCRATTFLGFVPVSLWKFFATCVTCWVFPVLGTCGRCWQTSLFWLVVLGPSSVKLAGALVVLHPKDWSSCVTVDPPSTLTASRSGVDFLCGPSGAPWRPSWSWQQHLLEVDSAARLTCGPCCWGRALGQLRGCPGGRGGVGREGSRYPAALGGASLQYVPGRGLHVASHCVLLTWRLNPCESCQRPPSFSIKVCLFKMPFCFIGPSGMIFRIFYLAPR